MQQVIVNFYQDSESHWVALLACGHSQHVRHRPPYVYREWVLQAHSRAEKIGTELNCLNCETERHDANDQDSVKPRT